MWKVSPLIRFRWLVILAIFLPSILLALSCEVHAQGVQYTHKEAGDGGTAVPYPLVTVCTSGAAYTPLPCTPKASIYSDAALTVPLANPFRGDMFGNIEFYATPAAYIVSVTAPYSPGYSFKMSASGGFAGAIQNTQVAVGTGLNTIGSDGNLIWAPSEEDPSRKKLTVQGALGVLRPYNYTNALNSTWSIDFGGHQANAVTATFGAIQQKVISNTNGAVTGQFDFFVENAGTPADVLTLTGTGITSPNIGGIIWVDGIHFPTLASALATVPVGGAIIIDTFVEAFTVNPFASTTNPVWVQFGAGIWTTTTPVVLSANQWLTGAGPQHSGIKAVAGFSSTTQGVVTLGTTAETHSSFIRDMSINCNSIANCTGLVFDGAQNPTGASNVSIQNYKVDGVRLQQTTAATSAIKLENMWAYAVTGAAPSGAGLNVSSFSGTALVENFVQAADHSFPGPSAIKVGGGSGEFTCINCAGEGITDQFLLTGTGATSVIIGASQNASTSPGVNTVHVGAGVNNYNLINVSQGNSTGAALVDDSRGYTCTGSIQFLVVSGSATKSDFGACATIGWIRTPATTVSVADTIQLQAGFTGSNSAYLIKSDAGASQYIVSNDGRVSYRGNQSGAFVQTLASDTLTANRVVQSPNGPSSTTMVAALVTTAAATDNVTIQGMTASGHCSLTPTNAAAIGAATPPGVTTKTANQITVTHAVTANMNYDILCTSN